MANHAPGIQEFIDRCNAAMPPDFFKLPNEQQRALYHGLTLEFFYEVPAGVTTEDVIIQHGGRGVPARIYRPAKRGDDGLLIYIRGGGFVVGSLETHNTVLAELCDKTGLVAVAPDFRLAPEHPFPAALEDCYDVVCGLASRPDSLEIDPRKIVICGDSSGGNMAVVVSMMARDRGGPALRGQALISPVLDFTRWRSGGADAPLLTGGEMEYYTACYAPLPEHVAHPYVSPLVSGRFDRLPPAYVMGAEMDSLLVDSQAYAQRLRENGIPVELVVEPGLVHSAVRARGLSPQVADAWRRYCAAAARLARTGEA
ncbi:MAG: alpha/beta hydrolase [Myxococcaceae bacterium]|nr:alpha/beta hydrolase [Myxococcaceae bacterium]